MNTAASFLCLVVSLCSPVLISVVSALFLVRHFWPAVAVFILLYKEYELKLHDTHLAVPNKKNQHLT